MGAKTSICLGWEEEIGPVNNLGQQMSVLCQFNVELTLD